MRKYSLKLKTVGYQLLILIFAFLSPVYADTSMIEIKKIDIEGLYSIKEDELLKILGLKVGNFLNPLGVREGIKLAFLKEIFEDIYIESEINPPIPPLLKGGEGGLHIKIRVKERDRIEGIYISGNEYLTKRALRNLFLFKDDQVIRYDLIEHSINELKKTLSEKGFPRSEIDLKVERTDKPNMVNIVLTVQEGTPEIIKNISVNGPEDVRGIIKVSEGDIYDQVRVRKDMEKIRVFYKNNNYLNPSIGYAYSDGKLSINVNAGKRLRITFEGNVSVSSKLLVKEAPFFEAEDFRDDLVEETVSRITSLYHSRGYPSVQVAPVITAGKDIISIHFFIFEGGKVIVNSIRFSGIMITEKNLKEVMLMKEGDPYNPDLLENEEEILEEFYDALGYLDVYIEDIQVKIKDSKADVDIKIHEGVKTFIESIEIRGTESISKEDVEKVIRIKVGDTYNEVDISDARYRIIDLYGTHGFINSKVDLKQELDEKGIKVIFEINEGPLTFFGRTVVSGNTKTKYEVIDRELVYKIGSPFNSALLSKTRHKLYKLGLFTSVDIETAERADNIKDVLINVKEGNAGVVEFAVGYGDYERFRGAFDISYRNLFGMNRQISFRTELSSLEQRYILNYLEPYFLDMPNPFRVLFLREERTEKSIETRETRYKLRRHSASAGIEKKLSDKFKGEIFYEFSFVKTFEVKPDVILTREDTGTLAISSIRPGIVYDTRDNPFDPRRGTLSGISLKTASSMLFSETDFIKAIASWSIYRELGKHFVFAISLKSGVAQGFNETRELPLVERFFLGGRTTVRGYEQDTLGHKGSDGSPTGGNAFVLTNFEIRTSFGKGFGIVTFLDGGNVWLKAGDIEISGMKYTTGLGIRYNTPVGPVRVDYGHKLQREKGESSGEIHFSIGHAF